MKYQLVEKGSKLRETFVVTIIGDSNDADYVTETMHFNEEDFEEILPELANIRNNYGKNHQLEDYPNPMDLYVPFNGNDGYCHSLEKLTVEYIDHKGKIWDVEF